MIVYRDAYYCFRANTHRKFDSWWQIFTRNARFDHVSAFYYDPLFELWQLIEWSEYGLFFGTITPSELDNYIVLLAEGGGKILRYKANEIKSLPIFPPISWSYCVAGAKQFANIRAAALTPDQFFRALRRRGARGAFLSVTCPNGEPDGIPEPEYTASDSARSRDPDSEG